MYQPIFPVWVEDYRQKEGCVLLATADFAAAGAMSSAAAVRDHIEVSYSVTEKQRDGDLLANIKGIDGAMLTLPQAPEDWPDRRFLEHRFKQFRERLG